MRMRKFYNIAGCSIVGTWVALMTLLVLKQTAAFRPVQLEKQYIGATVESRQDWSGIYMQGSKIGYSFSEIKRIEEGYQVTEEIFMDLTVMGRPQRIQTRVTAVADADMRVQILSFRLVAGVISMSATGTVQGKRMRLRIKTGGKTQWRTIPLQEPPVLTSSLRYFVLKQGIKPGMEYSYPFFDPLTLTSRTMKVEVFDKEQIELQGKFFDCYKVQTSFQGITVSSWVNDQGETLREESPMGLVMLRESREQALEENLGEKPDITAATSIKVNKSFSAARLSYLKLRLRDVVLDGFDLDSGRQKLDGNLLEIRLEELPASGAAGAADFGPDLQPFLDSSPFIQSDDAGIIACAKNNSGKEKTAVSIVRALNSWVYANIDKKPTLSIPSAVAVLASKQGDCNEHAVLLAALCRAAGIPARVAAGLVYQNGSFFYHAWCEVFVGRWITVDPAMNQFPADVSHIKFVDGDLENHLGILRLIGKLHIDVVGFL